MEVQSMSRFSMIALTLLVLGGGAAQAQPAAAAPQDLVKMEAPRGVTTASIDLGGEFPQMRGYVLTQNIETVPPGTGRHWHTHTAQPEIMRIVSGVLTEARNGQPPAQFGPGATITNPTGTQHAWANLGSEPVVALVTVIKKADPGAR